MLKFVFIFEFFAYIATWNLLQILLLDILRYIFIFNHNSNSVRYVGFNAEIISDFFVFLFVFSVLIFRVVNRVWNVAKKILLIPMVSNFLDFLMMYFDYKINDPSAGRLVTNYSSDMTFHWRRKVFGVYVGSTHVINYVIFNENRTTVCIKNIPTCSTIYKLFIISIILPIHTMTYLPH